MRKFILLIATSLLLVPSLQAVPLTWHFFGTTGSNSQYNGMSIGGLSFELRIFLDTDLVGVKVAGLSDVFFQGPHQGEVVINTLGVLPVNPFSNVQYFAPGGSVTGVQFSSGFFAGILFNSVISTDSLHLTAIAPTTPGVDNTLDFFGPNGLSLFGAVVSSFSATTVPEDGAATLLLTIAFLSLGVLRLKIRRAVF